MEMNGKRQPDHPYGQALRNWPQSAFKNTKAKRQFVNVGGTLANQLPMLLDLSKAASNPYLKFTSILPAAS